MYIFNGKQIMQRIIWGCGVLVVFCVVVLVAGAILETSRSGTVTFRDNVAGSTDSALGTSIAWGDRLSSKMISIRSSWNAVVLTCFATADNATCTDMEIWGYRDEYSARHFLTASIKAGAALDDSGRYIGDSCEEIFDNCNADVRGATDDDLMFTITIDVRECKYVKVLFPTISAGTWDADITGF